MGIRPDIEATRRFRTAGKMSSPSAEPARRRHARNAQEARLALSLCLAPIVAVAQSANTGAGGDPRTSVAQPEVSGKPSAVAMTSIQSVLDDAADPTGLRRFLSDCGVVLSFNAIADILGDTSGGTRRTATVLRRLDMQLDADLERHGGRGGVVRALLAIGPGGKSRYHPGDGHWDAPAAVRGDGRGDVPSGPRSGGTVQPNLRYVFHPGGNILDARDALGRWVKDATVVSMRATLTY